MLESYIERRVCLHAKRMGVFVRKVAWTGRRGAPDRFFAMDGVSAFIEFKRPGERPRPEQRREIARMRAAGLTVIVIDDIEDGIAVLQHLFGGRHA